MDFMRLLKSLEELLYELVSWLLFYPITLWRSLARPGRMMRYADTELADSEPEQYADTISPPLFLLITLLIVHGLELGLIKDQTWAAPPLLSNDSNLLVFRAVMFSIFPLLMAVKQLRFKKAKIDRHTLKPPFYSQCYVAAPFVFAVSLSGVLWRTHNSVVAACGLALLAVALVWYVAVETRWFSDNVGLSPIRAFASVTMTVTQGTVAILLVATLFAIGQVTAPGA